MASVSIDDNFVKGLLVKGDTTGADVIVLGDETTGAMLVKPVDFETPNGDSMVDDVNDALKTTIAGSITPGTAATNLGKAEDAVHASEDVGVMSLAVRNDTLAALGGTDGDYAPLQVNALGGLYVAFTSGSINGPAEPTIDSYTHASINLNAGANQVLVSSAPSKQIWVYGIVYTCSVDGTVSFQDELDVAITGIMDHAAKSGLGMPVSGNFAMPIWKLGTDKDLEVDVVTAAIDGFLDYAIVSV